MNLIPPSPHNRMTVSYWTLLLFVMTMFGALLPRTTAAQQQSIDYRLSVGDSIRVQVFQNPDMTVEARISDNGAISYPLIGSVELAGMSIAAAEKKIADALRTGNYLVRPQVNIVLLQVRGNQVAVLGYVNRPGRFPLDTVNTRVTEVLAMAGGATTVGADYVILTGTREGKPYRRVIDVTALFLVQSAESDVLIAGGDALYVPRAPMFYIYGEAQRPGAYRIERNMTIMQALATGGGPTTRGSETRLRLHRRDAAGAIQQSTPQFSDPLQADDVIYVRESLF